MENSSKLKSIITSPSSLSEAVIAPAVGAFLIIMIPLIAMQFTSEVVWTTSDFIIAWTILFSIGFAFQAIGKRAKNSSYKFATGIAAFTTLFVIWSNLAVGIIGNEDNPLNLMYFGVVLLMVFGSYIAQLKAKAMSKVLFASAVLHALVSIIGLSIFSTQNPGYTIVNIAIINVVLVTMWAVSGLLYGKASEVVD
ncbi:MAG: hypothetical protein JJ895_07865 [Balneolaceae bacterium]|nr:hypothetical protein [Balneolaceae bacterium]